MDSPKSSPPSSPQSTPPSSPPSPPQEQPAHRLGNPFAASSSRSRAKNMVGFGSIIERSLPEADRGRPYFYYENYAIASQGVWQIMKHCLFDIEPEFVDSGMFCAARRRCGYIQNIPIMNRVMPEPQPRMTIGDAFPEYNRFSVNPPSPPPPENSSGNNMSTMINQYKIQHAYELKKLELAEQTKKYLPHKELLEVAQSNLEEPNVDSLSSLEDQLETAMSVTRARKEELMMESVKTLQEKGKLLREENRVLASQLTEMEKNERAMSSENSSVNNPPETLPLLK